MSRKSLDNKLHLVGIGAHPDDAGFGIGGTLAKYVGLGHRATIVSVSLGETIVPPGKAQERVAQMRKKEGEDIASVLGADFKLLGYKSNTITPTLEFKQSLANLFRELKANILFFPTPWDTHPDHRNLSLAVRDALYWVNHPGLELPHPPGQLFNAFMYDIEFFSGGFSFKKPDLCFDITETMEKKLEALKDTRKAFPKSSQELWSKQIKVWNQFWGLYSQVEYAEPLYFANYTMYFSRTNQQAVNNLPET